MTTLSNPKHEIVAQALAAGATQEQAYIRAGYCEKNARANASHLITTNHNILARVKELQDAVAQSVKIDMEQIFVELEVVRKDALALGQYGTALNATMAKVKLLCLAND